MMRPVHGHWPVYLCMQPIDFRKGMGSLAVLVETQLALNPFTEALFIFRNRSATAVKVLYWECNGFCLWQKRLEKERFIWPKPGMAGCLTLTVEQLNGLLIGYDITAMKPHQPLHFQTTI